MNNSHLMAAAVSMAILTGTVCRAAIKTETIEYKLGDTVMEGYLAYDDAIQGSRPAVLIIHEWWGMNDYVKRRAREVAALGYVAFAADMYGKGLRATTMDEAAKLSRPLMNDRPLMRARAAAALAVLKESKLADPARMAAMGYCFGGTSALELARSGADLAGVVSFHGNLSTSKPEDARNVKAKVLALTGADDPYTPAAMVQAFEDEMRKGQADWQLIVYGDAVHSFTNPDSGNDKSKGAAYNEKADHRSWAHMKLFYEEIFGRP